MLHGVFRGTINYPAQDVTNGEIAMRALFCLAPPFLKQRLELSNNFEILWSTGCAFELHEPF